MLESLRDGNMSQTETYLQVHDAAAFLGVSPNTIRNWGRDAKLPEYRHPLNNYRLYKQSDLVKVLRMIRKPVPASARPKKPR